MKKLIWLAPAGLAFFMMLGILYLVPVSLALVLTFLFGQSRAYSLYMDHITAVTLLGYVTAFIPTVIWYRLAFMKKDQYSGNTGTFTRSHGISVFLLIFFLNHGISLLLSILALLLPKASQNYDTLVETGGLTSYSVTWFLAVIVFAPLVEEMVFRGLILRYISKTGWPFWIVNLIQAALFGFYHLNLIQGIYAFILGSFLGFIARHYRALKASVFAHAVFNLCGTVLVTLESRFLSPASQAALILLSIPASIVLTGVIAKQDVG